MTSSIKIRSAARSSPLSRIQVEEVLQELQPFHPVVFSTTYLETMGDLDQATSLRTLGKTDFFTKEIDGLVLSHECDIGIHSAKDLPEPLPEGLSIFAITKGVDPSDSLVFHNPLPPEPLIATSSQRREELVRQIIPDSRFCDLRGTIQQRLAILAAGDVDGVVLAEAALIRLKLTHLKRVRLPGETVPFQGQLAVVGRTEDRRLQELFSAIDSREPASCP